MVLKWYKFEFFDWIPTVIRSQSVKHQDWQIIRKSMLNTDLEFKYETLQNWLEKNKYSDKSKIQTQNYMQALKRGGLIE
jgi:nucleoside-specific outer membrane channel protein Tsx